MALAGQDVSKWVLNKLLPAPADELQLLVDQLRDLVGESRYQVSAQVSKH